MYPTQYYDIQNMGVQVKNKGVQVKNKSVNKTLRYM